MLIILMLERRHKHPLLRFSCLQPSLYDSHLSWLTNFISTRILPHSEMDHLEQLHRSGFLQKDLSWVSEYIVVVFVTKPCLTLETPWTIALHAPLSMRFSRQECWSGLPFPSPEDLPNPGIKPVSPALQADSLPTEPPGKQCR